MEPFEEPGTWWLPEHEADARGGTIRFAYGNSGLTLTLIGAFPQPKATPRRQSLASYPIILGKTSSGRLMTLESARSISIQRVGLEDTTLTETISGTELFIGAHLPGGSPSMGLSKRRMADSWNTSPSTSPTLWSFKPSVPTSESTTDPIIKTVTTASRFSGRFA
jgi:hypothetical protein